jgi:murein L,D-transpeptidase YcbB/YkuD
MMNDKVRELINENLKYAASNKGRIDDSVILYQMPLLTQLYLKKTFSPLWSSTQHWLPQGESLLGFIENIKLYGLFPQDYHAEEIGKIKTLFMADSNSAKEKKDAALWSRADILLSDALVNIIHDLKLGRLPQDSITMRKDSFLTEEFVFRKINAFLFSKSFDSVITTLEPKIKEYHELKAAMKSFLDSADFKPISLIVYPDSNKSALRPAVVKRLFEKGYIDSVNVQPDSLQLSVILKKYQADNKLTADGKIGGQTIRMLNLSDLEKFKRIAITLDRFKMLPEIMPEKYIWVNIPSYNLKLLSSDTVILSSRVVVGKPKTRTPVLSSSISEIITYPQWVIPQSIIVKEILPGIKKDSGYLTKKGYALFDKDGEEIDPATVDWTKYTKGIPYRVIQGSGDDNALGVLKFNFWNKYAVYLHDTNQRYYFSLDSRALSHGCVRVQEWEKMANYIIRNESEVSVNKKKPVLHLSDSLAHWLAVKEKHSIQLQNGIPVFIRYFTCQPVNGRIVFFEDIYDEDKQIGEKLFANKTISK